MIGSVVLAACLAATASAAAAADGSAPAAPRAIGCRKQVSLDERFIAEKRDVAVVVNPPVKAGPIDVEASTAPCMVERDGVCHIYQGLNGPTSLWTSIDGLRWTPRGRIAMRSAKLHAFQFVAAAAAR